MNLVKLARTVLLISIRTFSHVNGLRLCVGEGALEAYDLDKICCNKTVFERVDDHKRERDCCSSILYYTDLYDCVDGILHTVNPSDPLPPALTRPMEKEPRDRICEQNFVYRLRNIQMTNSSDQNIRATVGRLNLKELHMTENAKWWKVKRINISMDKSLFRKYVGKTVFVFSYKNLLRKNSLDLSSGDIIVQNKFRIRYIKKCSQGALKAKQMQRSEMVTDIYWWCPRLLKLLKSLLPH